MKQLFSTDEAAMEIGIAPETLRYYAWRYQYGTKIGGTLIFSARDIELIRQQREEKKGKEKK
jgi:DNA-binding transcriptional MerR regulator